MGAVTARNQARGISERQQEAGLEVIMESWRGEIQYSLARRWPDFVHCSARLATEGPFLLEVLRGKDNKARGGMRILDSAMGMGCETIFLASLGFDVIGNEVNGAFRAVAVEVARRSHLALRVTASDWRHLEATFGADRFDYTLLLGNSLCLLREKADQREVARNLARICVPGGAIIVDQRNFTYMLNERHTILAGEFRYSGKVMYCGSRVRGTPSAIDDTCVQFTYLDVSTREMLGKLDMYPFRNGELIELFEEAGFRLEACYSDLVSGFRDDADFYTYVLRR